MDLNTRVKELKKIDTVANLVEQMYLAHAIKDEPAFKKSHAKASRLLHEILYE